MLPHVQQIASESLLYSTGSGAQCSVMTGSEDAREAQERGVYVYI